MKAGRLRGNLMGLSIAVVEYAIDEFVTRECFCSIIDDLIYRLRCLRPRHYLCLSRLSSLTRKRCMRDSITR